MDVKNIKIGLITLAYFLIFVGGFFISMADKFFLRIKILHDSLVLVTNSFLFWLLQS